MQEQEKEIILKYQRKRRNHKIKLAIVAIIATVVGIITIMTYFSLSKNEYNTYTEKAKVNYRVNLKENEFYEKDYLDEKSSIIASLIKNLEVNFKYNLNLAESQEYTYRYKIVAKTNVKETTRANSIYETTEELLNKEQQISDSKNLQIEEKLTIDYNEFNEKINKFINVYNLDNTTNTVELSMYVYVTNTYDGKQINKESKVMALNIPLTTKTVDISINSNVIEDAGTILTQKSEYENIEWTLAVGIILLLIGLITFIRLIKYILDTRSAEKMYEQELKNIMFNYKTYIQKTNNEVDTSNYKVIQINTFNEMLGMRDTIQAPILMYTEPEEERTKFMIINNDIIYVYILGAKEIRNELRAKSAKKKEKEENKKSKEK